MCDPQTIGNLQIANGLIGAVGSYYQGKMAQAEYNYQANILRQNANIAEVNAKVAEMNAKRKETEAHETVMAGGAEEARLRLKIARLKGEQKAVAGASGFEITSGSNLETLLDTEEMGARDIETLRYNYQVNRWGHLSEADEYIRQALEHKTQAVGLRGQADMSMVAGKHAKSAGKIGALTGLIGTGMTVASSWYQMGYNPLESMKKNKPSQGISYSANYDPNRVRTPYH